MKFPALAWSAALVLSVSGCPGKTDLEDEDTGRERDTRTEGCDSPELCDGVDNDCDGEIDEAPAADAAWYVDSDGDGYGTDTYSATCEQPEGTASVSGDCDDEDVTVHPDADEACNLDDDDCDGEVDDGYETGTVYRDRDGDGFGDPDRSREGCLDAEGWVEDGTDCDDEDDSNHPSGAEICDAEDNDCDGDIDEGYDPEHYYYRDGDGDGFGDSDEEAVCEPADGWVADNTDCDDEHAEVWPGALETCGDGLANDCNSTWEDALELCLDEDVVLSTDAFSLEDTDRSSQMGHRVSLGGDVNGDGVADLAVGAPYTSEDDAGRAYLFLGPVTADRTTEEADAALQGEHYRMGGNVSLEGDLDGDGYADWLVSDDGVTGEIDGAVYVVLGPVTGELASSSADGSWTNTGGSRADTGAGLSAGHDTDGDGLADALVAQTGHEGYACLFSGPPTGEERFDEAMVAYLETEAYVAITTPVSIEGDLDGDGTYDIAVGASFVITADTSDAGRAYVAFSPVEGHFGLEDSDLIVEGTEYWALAGGSLAVGGDWNGDGTDDLVVGEPGLDDVGEVCVVSGTLRGIVPITEAMACLLGPEDTTIGFQLAWQGDRDRDGTRDLLVGGSPTSEAWLLLGPTSGRGYLDDEAEVHLQLEDEDELGTFAFESLSLGGDGDGDGQDDLLAGSLGDGAWFVPFSSP